MGCEHSFCIMFPGSYVDYQYVDIKRNDIYQCTIGVVSQNTNKQKLSAKQC